MPVAVSLFSWGSCEDISLIVLYQIVENGLATAKHEPIAAGVGLAQILGNGVEDTPLHCGSYTMEAGSETIVDYPCSLFSLILEGKYHASSAIS